MKKNWNKLKLEAARARAEEKWVAAHTPIKAAQDAALIRAEEAYETLLDKASEDYTEAISQIEGEYEEAAFDLRMFFNEAIERAEKAYKKGGL